MPLTMLLLQFEDCFNPPVYKIDKNVKNCRKLKITLIQVIHTERCEKGGKNSHFQKLSTLSTLKEQKSVDYL